MNILSILEELAFFQCVTAQILNVMLYKLPQCRNWGHPALLHGELFLYCSINLRSAILQRICLLCKLTDCGVVLNTTVSLKSKVINLQWLSTA